MKKKILFLCFLTSVLMPSPTRAQVSFWANTPSGHSLHFWHWDDCDTCVTVEIGPATIWWDTTESSYVNLIGDLFIPETVSSNGRTYTVKSISYGCFSNCVGLTSVSIPSSLNYINAAVFRGCTGLTNVSIPNSVRRIGYDAFKNCTALTSITIPTSIEKIDGEAFAGCIGLSSITIPFSVKRMEYGAFRNCTNMTSINFYADSCLMCYNNGQSYFENVFVGCTNVTTINISDNVRYISPYAFCGCTSVEAISIGKNLERIYENSFDNTLNSLTTINYNAINYSGSFYPFIGRSSITTVNIGDEVTMIPHLAFKDCTGLRTITIGSAVDNIKNRAFYGCDHLISITCRAQYPPICQEETFSSVPRYADVIVPCGTAYRYQASNYWNEFTRIIEDCDAIDDVEDLPNIKINVIDGYIVVDGAENNTVWLYDVNGHVLTTKQDEYTPLHFDVPTSGTYLVKIGNHPARKVVVIR